MSAQTGRTRQSNMELLRIIAMLMIITLHYLDKGMILGSFSEIGSANSYLSWGLEALCEVAVNIYVLISGYFLIESRFTFRKVIILWTQVLFYSWVIGAIFLGLRFVPAESKGIYDLIFIVFPITSGHYWFATIYILLFALFPFLNAGITRMGRKQHLSCIIAMIVIFCLWNSFLPFTIPLADGKGMDIAWFVCLYLIAAYLRKYPIFVKWKAYQCTLLYIGCAVLAFGIGLAFLWIDSMTGKLGGYATNFYNYNSLLTLTGSVALFLAFAKIKSAKGWLSNVIIKVAGCTFGVYLIHEHRYLRYLWPQIFKVPQTADKPYMIAYLFGVVLALFAVCALIEYIRQLLFGLIWNSKLFLKMQTHFEKAEKKINGECE